MQGILVLLDQAGTAIAQLQQENRELRDLVARLQAEDPVADQ